MGGYSGYLDDLAVRLEYWEPEAGHDDHLVTTNLGKQQRQGASESEGNPHIPLSPPPHGKLPAAVHAHQQTPPAGDGEPLARNGVKASPSRQQAPPPANLPYRESAYQSNKWGSPDNITYSGGKKQGDDGWAWEPGVWDR